MFASVSCCVSRVVSCSAVLLLCMSCCAVVSHLYYRHHPAALPHEYGLPGLGALRAGHPESVEGRGGTGVGC